jgi:hypothetical protein
MGAPNVPTMRDIKFHASFSGRGHAKGQDILFAEMILTEFLPRARSTRRPRAAFKPGERRYRASNANSFICGDAVLAQHRQAAYWGAMARA